MQAVLVSIASSCASVARVGLPLAMTCLVAACDEGDTFVSEPGPTISVSVLPLPPLDGQLDYQADLRFSDRSGSVLADFLDLPMRLYGDGMSAMTFVAACTPGDAAVGLAVHDVNIAGEGPIADIVQPARVSVGIACTANGDVLLDYGFELATLREDADGAAIAFADLRCTAQRSCDADRVGVQVACVRQGGDGRVELGISQARLVCGALDLPISPEGEVGALGIAIDRTPSSEGDRSGWSLATATTDLPGCRIEAAIIAAPELVGGHGQPCTGWPVMRLALPLSTSACASERVVDVAYQDGASFTSELVVDALGTRVPSPTAGWTPTCAATPDVWQHSAPTAGSGEVTVRDAPQGFIDVALEVKLPR